MLGWVGALASGRRGVTSSQTRQAHAPAWTPACMCRRVCAPPLLFVSSPPSTAQPSCTFSPSPDSPAPAPGPAMLYSVYVVNKAGSLLFDYTTPHAQKLPSNERLTLLSMFHGLVAGTRAAVPFRRHTFPLLTPVTSTPHGINIHKTQAVGDCRAAQPDQRRRRHPPARGRHVLSVQLCGTHRSEERERGGVFGRCWRWVVATTNSF